MLGFSPLASSPIGDDGGVIVDDGSISLASITTGAPVVESSALSSEHALNTTDITAGEPALGASEIEVDIPLALSANDITTSNPTVGGRVYDAGSLDGFIYALETSEEPETTFDAYWFSDDGLYFYRNGQGSTFGPDRYTLSTPFDIATGTLSGSGVQFNPANLNLRLMTFQINSDGTKFYGLTREYFSSSDTFTYRFATYDLSPAFDTSGSYSFSSSFYLADQQGGSAFDRIYDAVSAGGDLYTIQLQSDSKYYLQKRSLSGSLISETPLINEGSFPKIAPLTLDGSLRIYVTGNVYSDDLTLIDTSGDITALGIRNYLVRPDGFALLAPSLHEFDGDPQPVVVVEAQATGLSALTSSPPVLDSSSIFQDHIVDADQIILGEPSSENSDLFQDHIIEADQIISGEPDVSGALAQTHQLSLVSIETPQPVFSSSDLTQEHQLSIPSVVTGNPTVDAASFTQDHEFTPAAVTTGNPTIEGVEFGEGGLITPEVITTGNPVVPGIIVSEENTFNADSIIADRPTVDTSNIAQAHNLNPTAITTGQPVIGASDITQDFDITIAPIIAGQPIIPSVTMAEEETFFAETVTTGLPTVDASIISQEHDLTLTAITTGLPDVSGITMSEDETFNADNIVSGIPSVGASDITQGLDITLDEVTTGTPAVAASTVTQGHVLTAANINTAPPTIDSTNLVVIGVSRRREASLNDSDNGGTLGISANGGSIVRAA